MAIEATMTVGELRELYHTGEYDIQIDTPDGYQFLGEWFDKGMLDMVRIATPSHETTCAVNHMIQMEDDTWVLASELDVGAMIKTLSGDEPVIAIEDVDAQECYDFEVLHPNHRYYGDGIVSHNSGKSFLASGNMVRDAQRQGIFVILIDSENALDESWLHALDVDTSEEKLLKLNMAMIDDVGKMFSDFVKGYREDYTSLPDEERPKILFVIDSLGMLMTPTEVNQFEDGNTSKGDMGRKAKALKAFITNCVNTLGDLNVGMVLTNHTYESQDMFNPDAKVSGGSGVIYASSIVIGMRKLKLREDEDGNKIKEERGIKAVCKVLKTRYAKPFEEVRINIPYDVGMSPYTGLIDYLETVGVLLKSGNRLEYIDDETGESHKFYRKEWNRRHDLLDSIMKKVDTETGTKQVIGEMDDEE